MAVSLFFPGFKDEFTVHANQEWSMRICWRSVSNNWGGVRIFDPEEIAEKAQQAGVVAKQGSSMSEMIGEDLLLERPQIEPYTILARKHARYRSGDVDDGGEHSGSD
jgi:hypothetical protein